VLQAEKNHVVYEPVLGDDVSAGRGDVSQILVNGCGVVGREKCLHRDAEEIAGADVIFPAVGGEELIEGAQAHQSRV